MSEESEGEAKGVGHMVMPRVMPGAADGSDSDDSDIVGFLSNTMSLIKDKNEDEE